ncbi:hypothetical protein B0H13DRAFT_2306041 [Mycena leptocephala]|nr:hypothetical protein B0H13DRAFT_2306041 [Mycena leptocephala]
MTSRIPAPAGSTSTKLMGRATTSLEVAVGILEQLSGVTQNVPYLNAITGPIQKLIQIHKVPRDNDKRARDLLNNIGEISLLLTEGLNDLRAKHHINIAITSLKKDLEGYESILSDTYVILQAWMSKGFVKRLLAHSDFPAIADGVDRKLNAFRDAFNFKRLIALFTGQETLHTKIQTLLDENTRKNLAEWLKPADVAISQRDATNKCQTGTGLWFLESAEFIKISYATSTFLWLQGISGSGKTALSHLLGAKDLAKSGSKLPRVNTAPLDGNPPELWLPARAPIDVEKVAASIADDRLEDTSKPARKEYPEKHRGRDTLGAIRDRNRDKLFNAPSSGAFWKEIKRMADPKPDPIAVTAESLREVFEKRLNPPAVMPSAFDKIQHKINRTLASLIPETTEDPSPERFFSAEWVEDDGAWVKDHLLNHSLDSASGEDGTTYSDIMEIPNEDLGWEPINLVENSNNLTALCGT